MHQMLPFWRAEDSEIVRSAAIQMPILARRAVAPAPRKTDCRPIWDYANATPRYLDFSRLDFRVQDLKLIAFDQKPAYIDLTK